jgi:hypothetical protein
LYINAETVLGAADAEHSHLAIRDRADALDAESVRAFPPRAVFRLPPIDDRAKRLVAGKPAIEFSREGVP